jgi:hypothetical protein
LKWLKRCLRGICISQIMLVFILLVLIPSHIYMWHPNEFWSHKGNDFKFGSFNNLVPWIILEVTKRYLASLGIIWKKLLKLFISHITIWGIQIIFKFLFVYFDSKWLFWISKIQWTWISSSNIFQGLIPVIGIRC